MRAADLAARAPLDAVIGLDEHRGRAFWAFAHGMVDLELRGRFPAGADLRAAWVLGLAAFEPDRRLYRARMADADDVRRLALALPDVVEVDSAGFDFRVSGKGFAWSWPERRPGRLRRIRTDVAVLFVGDEGEKQALLRGEPELFSDPGYEGWPLVLLHLERVDVARLEELLTDAWRMRSGRD